MQYPTLELINYHIFILKATSSLYQNQNESVIVGNLTCGACSWDPDSASAFVAAYGSSLNFVDKRKMEVTKEVVNAHKGAIRYVHKHSAELRLLLSCFIEIFY